VEIEPNVEALDIWTNTIDILRVNKEHRRRIILEQTDSNEIKNPVYSEQLDSFEIFRFRQYLEKNYIRKYSAGTVHPFDYLFWLGIGDLSCKYYVKTNWKKDSVIIVPHGYQGYIPLSKSDWLTFIQKFRQVKRQTFKVSNLQIARSTYNYLTENNIAAQYQVDKYDDLWGKPNLEWLKFDGSFKFKDTTKYEDFFANRIKVKLMAQYPNEKFSVEIYNPDANLNNNEYHHIITVFCNEDFFKKFHYKTVVKDWKATEVLITAITDDQRMKKLESIIVDRLDLNK
jgi:hypothetical protein